jgi:hypothetical protein
MLAFQVLGLTILETFGENARYDLIVDDGRRLLKVQCKSGRLRNGTVEFASCSTYRHHKNFTCGSRSYVGEVDAIAVYCHDNGGVYLVPIDGCGATQTTLRVVPSANNQSAGVKSASLYEIAVLRLEISDGASSVVAAA